MARKKFNTVDVFFLWVRAMRVHQWVKNILIFVPLVLAGSVVSLLEFESTLAGFFILSFTASATYILNDLLDIESDRQHLVKRNRPFASGKLSITQGRCVMIVIGLGVIFFSNMMPDKFNIILAAYTTLTLLYSFAIKSRAIMDVVAVSILFTLRIAAGMMFVSSPMSYWLLLFSFFFFLSLAFVKRYAELHDLAEAKGHKVMGRVYVVTDRPFIMSSGLASTFAGCLVFVIYIVNEHFPQNIYSSPQWLWAICAILVYWLVRIWFLASRGVMNQDPIIFALTDRASLLMGVLTIGCVWLAW